MSFKEPEKFLNQDHLRYQSTEKGGVPFCLVMVKRYQWRATILAGSAALQVAEGLKNLEVNLAHCDRPGALTNGVSDLLHEFRSVRVTTFEDSSIAEVRKVAAFRVAEFLAALGDRTRPGQEPPHDSAELLKLAGVTEYRDTLERLKAEHPKTVESLKSAAEDIGLRLKKFGGFTLNEGFARSARDLADRLVLWDDMPTPTGTVQIEAAERAFERAEKIRGNLERNGDIIRRRLLEIEALILEGMQ